LVGIWSKDGAPYAELKADGTGTVNGESVRWDAKGGMLYLLGASGAAGAVPYKIEKGALKTLVDGMPATLTKGKPSKGGKSAKASPAKDSTPAGKDQLSKLLMSSAWCSFRYNKVSGASSQSRAVFRPNGTWGSGARAESYSSGAYGSVAGQTDSSGGGRWQVKQGRLLMSEGAGALADVGLTVSRNSNGYPILNADGKEYSQCN